MFEPIRKLIQRWSTRNPSQAGKWFEKEVRKALIYLQDKHSDFWFQRIWDYKTFIRLNQKFFAPKMIADFMAVHRGHFYALEAKTSQSPRYNVEWIKAHQVESAIKVERAGGTYWFLICRRIKSIGVKHLYALRPMQWIYLRDEAQHSGYRSVTWEDIARNSIELFKKHGIWDLSILFKNMINRLDN